MKPPIKTSLIYFGILALVLAMGMSVWLLPKPIQKEEEQPITPPIDAKDEAGRYIQKASETNQGLLCASLLTTMIAPSSGACGSNVHDEPDY